MNLKVIETPHWIYCFDDDINVAELLEDDTCGKWMYTFERKDMPTVFDIIRSAITEGACIEAKMSNYYNVDVYGGTGVVCFYINGTDDLQHKTLIRFMLDHDLFIKDPYGILENAPFKFDWQTAANQYGDSFIPEILLSDYVNLSTGEFLD